MFRATISVGCSRRPWRQPLRSSASLHEERFLPPGAQVAGAGKSRAGNPRLRERSLLDRTELLQAFAPASIPPSVGYTKGLALNANNCFSFSLFLLLSYNRCASLSHKEGESHEVHHNVNEQEATDGVFARGESPEFPVFL